MCRLHLALVLLLLVPLTAATAHAAGPAAPRFETTRCVFGLARGMVDGKNVTCGNLVVPENRAKPNSPLLHLAVVIFRSASVQRAPDPLVLLGGGPGQGIVAATAPQINQSALDTLSPNRDFILIDQRGTGLSQRATTCPEVDTMDDSVAAQHLSLAREQQLEADAVGRCRARLVRAGVNLDAYTTLENAADIADLRVALGYSQMNLYSISYGTRLALTVLHYHPQGIRSVVLDAAYAPQFNMMFDPMGSTAHAFNLLLSACAQASGCGRTYPHLRTTLYALVTRLDRSPHRIRFGGTSTSAPVRVEVTGERYVDMLFQALYASPLISSLPGVIAEAGKGNFAPTVKIFQAIRNPPGTMSWGMFYSVQCSEDAPYATTAEVSAAVAVVPAPLRADVAARWQRLRADCAIWHVRAVPPAQKKQVVSGVPAMLLHGEFDPIFPPKDGVEVAKTLNHSFSFTYPGMGHGTWGKDPCPTGMVHGFIADPSKAPNSSCIKTMPEPFR